MGILSGNSRGHGKRGGGDWDHCGHVGVHKLSHGVSEGMRRLARDSRIAFSASLSPVSSLQSLLCSVSRDTYADFSHSFDVRQLWTPAKKKKKKEEEKLVIYCSSLSNRSAVLIDNFSIGKIFKF